MFADVRAFQELTGHYDAMTLQGGHGVAVVGGKPPEKGFAGAQWFKLEKATSGTRGRINPESGKMEGGDNALPIGAWYCSDVSDAEECKKIAIDANNWRFAA